MIKRSNRRLRSRFEKIDPRHGAGSLVKALNDEHGKPGFDTVEQLVRDINEVDRLAWKAGYPEIPEDHGFWRWYQMTIQIRDRIDRFFRGSQFIASLGRPFEHGWNRSCLIDLADANGCRHHGLSIMNAAYEGYLCLISQCEFCSTWFASKRRDRKFCSSGCREKSFRQSDEGKNKRRLYMKRYRDQLRNMSSEY